MPPTESMLPADPPYLVTARLDAAAFARLDAMRRRHFPAPLNRVPAHISLFHQLPGDAGATICDDLRAACRDRVACSFRLVAPRGLGRGVALTVDAPGLVAVRAALAARWGRWLSPQDRQPFRPHVTIQNKVTPDAARALLSELQRGFAPEQGVVDGLLLWRYRGGPWEAAGAFPFAAAP